MEVEKLTRELKFNCDVLHSAYQYIPTGQASTIPCLEESPTVHR